MHTDAKSHKQDTTSFWRPLLILLCIAVILDILTLSRSLLISKDSVIYIRYAQTLDNHFFETIKNEYQHPGYPLLIRGLYAIVHSWLPEATLKSWIFSAQIAAVICHWTGICCFYTIGRNLVCPQHAFYCTLIFLFLPLPASLAIDALSDWPHLMFLLACLVFLIRGMKKSNLWDYSASGFLAGLGYLVRPEALQAVIYAGGWLVLIVILKKEKISKAIFFLGCFLAMFALLAVPYMTLKKSFSPKKDLFSPPTAQSFESHSEEIVLASILSQTNPADGLLRLMQRITETLFYYYIPFAVLGVWNYFKNENFRFWNCYLVFLVIILNTAMLCLLYNHYGYISKRHTLVISSFLIIFIPGGLELAAGIFMRHRNSINNKACHFHLLLTIGICICFPKVIKPLGYDKAYFLAIAENLKKQTRIEAIIAVPDSRIGFYSERQYRDYSHQNKRYMTDAWVELLPDKRYLIHQGAYLPRLQMTE